MNDQNDQNLYITEARVAEMLDLSPATLRNWRSLQTKTGPTWYKFPGGAIRYNLAELNAWIEGHRRDPSGGAG